MSKEFGQNGTQPKGKTLVGQVACLHFSPDIGLSSSST